MEEVTRRRFLQGAFGTALLPCTTANAHPHAPAHLAVTPRERQVMAGLVRPFMEAHEVPGLAIAFAHGGAVLHEQGFGFADASRRIAVTPDHRFRIASVTKPITACAVLGLIERKQLALERTVFGSEGVLGTTYGRRPYSRDIERITIDHLLTHVSGGWSNDTDDPMGQRPELSHADLISWVLDSRPLAARPGTRYAYSNFGYCVLGRVIEKVTGRPYAQHVRHVVMDRCQIRDMIIAGNTLAQRAPNEVEYFGERGEDPYAWNVRRMDSHGGWLATARDIARFATYFDQSDSASHLLSAATIRSMVAPSAANPRYARGWIVDGKGTWSHDGSLPGTTALVVRTAGGLCWAALANTRQLRSKMGGALDRLMWTLARLPAAWNAKRAGSRDPRGARPGRTGSTR